MSYSARPCASVTPAKFSSSFWNLGSIHEESRRCTSMKYHRSINFFEVSDTSEISNLAIITSNNISLVDELSIFFVFSINELSTYLFIFLSKSFFVLIIFLFLTLLSSTSSKVNLSHDFLYSFFSVSSAIFFSKGVTVTVGIFVQFWLFCKQGERHSKGCPIFF